MTISVPTTDVAFNTWFSDLHRMPPSSYLQYTSDDWNAAHEICSAHLAQLTPRHAAALAAYDASSYERDGHAALRTAYYDMSSNISYAHLAVNLTRLLSLLTTSRLVADEEVPAGHDIFPALYDLDGNVLGLAKDTYTGPTYLYLSDGSKMKYRVSRASTRAARARQNEKRGFRVGFAIAPTSVAAYYYDSARTYALCDGAYNRPTTALLPTADRGQGDLIVSDENQLYSDEMNALYGRTIVK